MAARASLLLDHVDAWLFQQRSLVNARAKTLLPILVQRQALADDLTRLRDKLRVMPEHALPGGISVGQAVIYIPDNTRDRLAAVGRTTNGAASRASVTRIRIADGHGPPPSSFRPVTAVTSPPPMETSPTTETTAT